MPRLPRAELHGVDISTPTHSKLASRAVMGAACMTEDVLGRHVYDASEERWLPMEYVPFEYDVVVDGGEVGDHALRQTIPPNTILWDGVYDVVEALNSEGTARIRISITANADVLALTLISAAGTAGLHDIVPDGTAAKAIKTVDNEPSDIVLSVVGAALTEGRLYGFLRCVRGFPADTRSSSSSASSMSESSASSMSRSSQSVSSASSQSSSSSSSMLSSASASSKSTSSNSSSSKSLSSNSSSSVGNSSSSSFRYEPSSGSSES
ncbi:MAG: hypothetical protein ABFD92_21410 [Planctomycetaceae bacterium]